MDEKNLLDKEFVVVTYMVIGGGKQATQVYVGFDVPDKKYLDTMTIKISGVLDAQALPIALSKMTGHDIKKLWNVVVNKVLKSQEKQKKNG